MKAVTIPNGVLSILKGPMKASGHDITSHRTSNIEHDLMSGKVLEGLQYSIYGDTAHCLRASLIVPLVEEN